MATPPKASDTSRPIVKVGESQAREMGITLVPAQPASIRTWVTLPGEVAFDPDRVAHVVPAIAGIVREVGAALGAKVRRGDVLAILESRELAEAKAAYLARQSRVGLAQRTFDREAALRASRVTSEQEYLSAQQALDEARIEARAAAQQLQALGLTQDQVRRLSGSDGERLARYELRSPMEGVIVEKHASRGESLEAGSPAFTIADSSTVWVNFKVSARDLHLVARGKSVELLGTPAAGATIADVAPIVDEETRTTIARAVLPNADARWRPGMFVTGRVLADDTPAALVVPVTAVQSLGDESVVFVPVTDGYEARTLGMGRRTESEVEVLSGIRAGELVVDAGSFALKSELEKSQFGEE